MDGAEDGREDIDGRAQAHGLRVPLRLRDGACRVRAEFEGGQTRSCGCAKPVPSAERKPKEYKAVTSSELVELAAPVGDDWMFGNKGGKGLFVTRRQAYD